MCAAELLRYLATNTNHDSRAHRLRNRAATHALSMPVERDRALRLPARFLGCTGYYRTSILTSAALHSAAVHRPCDERGGAAEEEAAYGKARLHSYVHFFRRRARLLTPEHAPLASGGAPTRSPSKSPSPAWETVSAQAEASWSKSHGCR